MIEIKFRIWNCHGQVMHQWPELVEGNKIHLLDKQQPTYKVMQYIGLKDKNGVEIYKGDIVGVNEVLLEVKYLSPSFRFFGVADTYGSELAHCRCEVVGNIHQNPELLESK